VKIRLSNEIIEVKPVSGITLMEERYQNNRLLSFFFGL